MNSISNCATAQSVSECFDEQLLERAPYLRTLLSPWDLSVGWNRSLRLASESPVYQWLRTELTDAIERTESGRNRPLVDRKAAEATLQALLGQLERAGRIERWTHHIGRPARIYTWQPSDHNWFAAGGTVRRMPLMQLAKAMAASGLLSWATGHNARGRGRIHGVRPSEHLAERLRAVKREHIRFDAFPEPIRLKRADGNYRSYRDNRKTKRMRKAIREINKNNKRHRFTLRVPMMNLPEVSHRSRSWRAISNMKIGGTPADTEGVGVAIDIANISSSPSTPLSIYQNQLAIQTLAPCLSACKTWSENGCIVTDFSKLTSFYRVFKHDFDSYGRFYAPFQSIPGQWRPGIEIDGEPTVEIDYSAQHARLLYHELSLNFDGDPYELADWSRDDGKTAFQILLNASSRNEAAATVANELELEQRDAWRLLKQIERKHQPLRDAWFFYSCAARWLQRVDSRIAETVMMAFVANDLPILGVHDSFVVRATQRDKLEAVMTAAYRELSGFDPVLKTVTDS